MAKGEITVEFICSNCGVTALELPDHYTDNSTAKCKKCGREMGRYGDLKKRAINMARGHARDIFRKAFKRKR